MSLYYYYVYKYKKIPVYNIITNQIHNLLTLQCHKFVCIIKIINTNRL